MLNMYVKYVSIMYASNASKLQHIFTNTYVEAKHINRSFQSVEVCDI